MNRLRVLSMVTESGHITPHSSSFASASAARISARVSVVVSISSPMRSSVCGRCLLPSVSVISRAMPSTNSHLARFFAAP